MKRIGCALAVVAGSICAGLPASAGSFSVNPVRLDMTPSQSATAVTISNQGNEAQLLQVRVYRWTHPGNDDVLTEVEGNEAPIVTPPLFRLAASGGTQVVRIGFVKPAVAATEERQWRVIIEEVPKPAGTPLPESAPAPSSVGAPIAIALRLRVSLPLFQRPSTVHQDLQWTLDPAVDGHLQLTTENRGSVTERIDEIRLGSGDDASRMLTGPFYVFPGERRSFDLHPHAALPAGPVTLSLQGTPRPLVRELVLRAQ